MQRASSLFWLPRLFLLAFFLVLFGTSAHAQIVEEHKVAMKDGVKLHTIVVRPSKEGKYPVLLSRSPYPLVPQKALAALGIVVVEQNTRGRYKSEGKDTLFVNDRQDGVSTVQWIKKQPWSDGHICTFGASALGITQYLMADQNPGVDAQFTIVATSDMYAHGIFPGGAFRQAMVINWSNGQAKSNGQTPPHPMLAEFEKNPFSNAPIWKHIRINDWKNIRTKGYHIGGWYDIFVQGKLDAFVGYQTKADPSVRNEQVLIMGPWVHNIRAKKAGQLTYPNSQMVHDIKVDQVIQGWAFKYILRQSGSVALDQLAPVNFYLMGDTSDPKAPGNEWIKAKTWPVPSQPKRLYLHAENKLVETPPSETDAKDTYTYDPKNPVPTQGGANLTIAAGPYDQRKVETRPDVQIYTTPPLEKPWVVAGRIRAKLWVSTDAKDTDFTVKLTDVYPDGRSMLVLDGIVRLRHRNTQTKEEFVPPNTPTPVTIDLTSTAIVFNKGHRIRIAVSSSNAPRYQPNPNTGKPFRIQPTEFVVAKNTVYRDKARASYIELPMTTIEDLKDGMNRPAPNENETVNGNETVEDAGLAPEDVPENSTPDNRSPDNRSPGELDPQETPKETQASDSNSPGTKAGGGCSCQTSSSGAPLFPLLLFLGLWVWRRQTQPTSF